MTEATITLQSIDKTLASINPTYVPPTARRWLFWKPGRSGIILLIADWGGMITYGSDAYELASRTGIMVEYHSMDDVQIPAIRIPDDRAAAISKAVRDQGGQIEGIY